MTKSMIWCLCGVAALAGCGASTGSPMVPAGPPMAEGYLAVTAQTPVASPLGGVAFVEELERQGTTNVFSPVATRYAAISGTFDHADQEATITDGTVTIVAGLDDSGFQGRDLTGYRYAGLASQFLAPPVGEGNASDSRISATAVVGIPTLAADMPVRGLANYTGDAVLTYADDSVTTSWRADALVAADFDRGKLRVTITPEAAADDDPFDQFERRNMTISGNRFTGGFARFTKDGRVVQPLGTGAASFAQGRFFGPADDNPAEVGGIIQVTGAGAEVTTTFIAQ